MTEMLPAQPSNGDEWEYQREHHEENSRCAFTNMTFEENETNDEREDAVHHVTQQQAPMKKLHLQSGI